MANNLSIGIQVASLSELYSTGPNTYGFVVKALNNANRQPLNNPNIANVNTVNATTTEEEFNINVPIVNATYAIPNVLLQVFRQNDQNCCVKEEVITLSNTQQLPPQNTMIVGGYWGQ